MFLSKYVSFEVKTRILLFLQKFRRKNYFSEQLKNKSKKAYVFLAADYGNLGDVAITYAQTHFLETTLPNYQIVDVPISKTLEGIVAVQKNIKKGDVVTTVGGGNLGDLYDQIEFYRQLVVKSFPKNKVISFPQTFDFANTAQGNKALKKALEVYNKHSNLVFVAREKVSYDLMLKHFKCATVLFTPDIVLSLNESNKEIDIGREGVVMCMRSDKEKKITDFQSTILDKIISSRFTKTAHYDTHIGRGDLSITERNDELQKIWNTFKNAELVVTDRLHGMIFCYITNTPCLVFLNNNHKVNGTYKWFPEDCNIELIEEFEEQKIKNSLKKLQSNSYAYSSLRNHYKPLLRQL